MKIGVRYHRSLADEPQTDLPESLARLAPGWGVQAEYWDIWSRRHEPAPDALQAILRSLGVASETAEDLEVAAEEQEWETWSTLLPPAVVMGENESEILVRAPAAAASGQLHLSFHWEQGGSHELDCELGSLPVAAAVALRGRKFVAKAVPLPVKLPLGYHRMEARLRAGGLEIASQAWMVVGPDRCYVPSELAGDGKTAGIAISLYGVRSERNWGCGDFTDLRAILDWAAKDAGASFVALNPLHSIPNRQPYNTSPYLPNSIFYRNFLYIDIESVPDFALCPAAAKLLVSARIQEKLRSWRESEFVEYEPIARAKRTFLKLLFRRFLGEYRENTERARTFRAWCEAEGPLLNDYAVYCALDEAIHKQFPNIWLWTDWPEEFRDPRSEAVTAFARKAWRSVLFHKYVQWELDRQLGAAQQHARSTGMSIGLYHDLALATDRYGSDLWAHRPYYISGCRVGSPPDDFSPKGQDWSFPPPNSLRHRADGYRLFAQSIRKNLRHGGALRIDHVMRFFRLYWIPDGKEATDGTYVLDRSRDLLRVLALESFRHQVMVIGEDLGTVTDEVREMLRSFGIFSYRLLYFEKLDGGRFKPPQDYPRQALASVATHDLPTLAGFWLGRDIQARLDAGIVDRAGYEAMLAGRQQEKQRMLEILLQLGLLPEWFPRSAAQVPELTGELHNAVIGFLAATPCNLLAINQEDLTKETEQQNLPGSTAEYPNWRHKMRFSVDELRSLPIARDCTAMLRAWLGRTGRLPA